MSKFDFCTKKHIAEYIVKEKEKLGTLIEANLQKGHARPRLLIIQVGDNPASNKYIKGKISDCNEVGIDATLKEFPKTISYDELTQFLLTERDFYHGIIIQKPTNSEIDSKFEDVIQYIHPNQDVDGFKKDALFSPCTPKGIVDYLEYSKSKKWFDGKHAVIVGRSNLVGRPLAKMLLDKDCTVTVAHSKTKYLQTVCRNADILVSAVGKANLIDKSFINNKHTTVINVGFDFIEGNMVGDVDVNSVQEITQWVTPIIGSTGLMTRLALLQNTYQAFVMQEIDMQ